MVQILDDFLTPEEFEDYKNRLQYARFSDVESQGMIYKDISQDMSSDLIYQRIKEKTEVTNPINFINFVRAYRDREPKHSMWIHSDVLFADYIAIFMIQSSDTPQDDGVIFWYNKELKDVGISTKNHTEEKNKIVDSQSLDPEKWKVWQRVEFKPNRMVIAPAERFHSKATYGNRGKTYKDCRIVHVLFYNQGEENV